ncbi:MAG: PqiC family protein [Gammaproteobacteria bacterium]|nr:PqiC family protein [Gammaproteobacteria bacterium]
MMRGAWLITALLAGCTAAPAPRTAEYLLGPTFAMEQAATVHTHPQAALTRVTVAPYLRSHGIVLETAQRRLETARDHRWAQPLDQSMRRVLQLTIAATSGLGVAAQPEAAEHAQILIAVDIHRFHGSADGHVQLVAEWQLRRAQDGSVAARHHFAERTATTAAGYRALVHAHAALTEELGTAIGRSLAGIQEREQNPGDRLN